MSEKAVKDAVAVRERLLRNDVEGALREHLTRLYGRAPTDEERARWISGAVAAQLGETSARILRELGYVRMERTGEPGALQERWVPRTTTA